MSPQNPDNKPTTATEADVQHVEVQPGVHEITIGETRESVVGKAKTSIEEKAADSVKRMSLTGNLPETQAVSQRQAAKLQEAKAAALSRVSEVLQGASEEELDTALEGLRDRVPRPGETFLDKTLVNAKTLRGEAAVDLNAPSIELGGEETVNLPHGLAEAIMELGSMSPDEMHEVSDINDTLKDQMERIKPGSYDMALNLDRGGLARLLKRAVSAWESRDGGRLASWTESVQEYAKLVGKQGRVEANQTFMPVTAILGNIPKESSLRSDEAAGLIALAIQNPEFAQKVSGLALAKGERFGAVLDRMAKESGIQSTVDSFQRLFEGDGHGFDEQENFFKVKDNMLPTLLNDAKLMGMLSRPDVMKKIYDLSAQTSPETVGALLSVMGRQIADDPSLLERAFHPLVFHELAAAVEGSMDHEFDADGKKMSVAQRIRNLVDTGKELAEVVRQRLPDGVPAAQKFPRAQV